MAEDPARIDALDSELAELAKKIDRPKPKDRWDKLSALSTVVSGVLIASMGLILNNSFNTRQLALQDIQKKADREIQQAQSEANRQMQQLQSDASLRLQRSEAEAADRERMADRLVKGYSLFTDEKTRLGGIYALTSLALDSPSNYWSIVEVLTAFVRQNSRWQQETQPAPVSPRPEIDAIVSFIRGRDARREKNQLVVYEEQDALLAIPRWELDPELQKKIDLSDVDLRKANLELAWLKRADLSGAHLEGSNLTDAHLERAVAHGARFDGADMRGAHLQWASVPLATFRETQLGGADLRHAQGITQEQINEALGDANTRLPPDLHRPPSWL